MKTFSIPFIIFSGILLSGCATRNNEDLQSKTGDNLITVSPEQFKNGKLSIGSPAKILFEDIIRGNGNIVAEPAGRAKISTPVQGSIKKIYCSGGQKILKGQALFELSGNEFFELQRDFAETANMLKRLKSEYERIRSLYDEKIGTEKDMIRAETEFKSSQAKFSALRLKLRSLGLDELKIESGDFYESFELRSPINGIISEIDASIGQYADLTTILAEVFDPSKMQLRVAVFEKDIGKIMEDQIIRFNLTGDTVKTFLARLTSVGRNVDESNKTITCFAQIQETNASHFVNNAYIEAEIITRVDTVYAVPEESILRSAGSNYILEFVSNENGSYLFKRTSAETGRTLKGFKELINIRSDIKLITNGAYNIIIE
ncbi:MAG: efflux RND transporter periplasmic adaptor subunit [Bacteroidales bacterium]|nr:efflux RND transporter periplasmic adaptor subunit [Bacteroidales bacterium]